MLKCGFARAASLLLAAGLWVGTASADPIPVGVFGGANVIANTPVTVKGAPPNPSYPVNFTFRSGGGTFTGTGGGFAATVDGINTLVWCVDSEEDISFPTSYHGDLVQLSAVASNPNYVRYGNLAASAWSLGLGSPYDTPAARYFMAAYLVSQYEGMPNGPSADDMTDRALQTAAWELTFNNSVTPGFGLTFSQIQSGGVTYSGANLTNFQNMVAGDISGAQACLINPSSCASFDPANWAILSGDVDAGGNLRTPGYQTYMVRLSSVPEPSTLGLLVGVLCACGLAAWKKRRARA